MADSQDSPIKESDSTNMSPMEMEMIRILSATGKYNITPKREEISGFPGGFRATSTPAREFGAHRENSYSLYSSPYLKSPEVPKIPQFSGEDLKGDVSYREWRFEVQCLSNDPDMTDSVLSQAIRKSLRGTARKMLIPLGENATLTSVLRKLDNLFGDISTNGMVMQEFYNAFQKEEESVTDFGCRLESLLHVAIENGHTDPNSKNEMLKHKFWTSLSSSSLKSQTRHKYDTIRDYDTLLREIRKVEKEINLQHPAKPSTKSSSTSNSSTDAKTSTKARQHSVQADSLSDLEAKFDDKITKLEKEFNSKLDKVLQKLDTLGSGGTSHSQKGNGQKKGYYGKKGQNQGQSQGQGNNQSQGQSQKKGQDKNRKDPNM